MTRDHYATAVFRRVCGSAPPPFFLGILLTVCAAATAAPPREVPPVPPVPPGLHIARVFGDHMVLQRDRPVNVWGWADAGDEVTVAFAGQSKSARAGADRKWLVTLDPLPASAESRALTVTCGTQTVTVKDVLVGEVWLLGGQSNMSMPIWVRRDGFEKADAERHPQYSQIRCRTTLVLGGFADPPYNNLCWIQRTPQEEIPFEQPWVVFEPAVLDRHAAPFSAFGFFFAKNLHDQLQVPIGLVNTAVGGTLAHYWAPAEEQRKVPDLAEFFENELWVPGCLYNTTIWPIRHLAFRGMAFYLGENNAMTKPVGIFEPTYRQVIESWRRTFGQPDLPVLIVQTASAGKSQSVYGPGPTNLVQEAQLAIHRSTPHTGFVVTADDVHGDLHVVRKQPHGERAARWAMSEVYRDVPRKGGLAKTWGTPVHREAKREGNRLLVTFDSMNDEPLQIVGEPAGFVVAGTDGKFAEARAEMVGPRAVALWSESVAEPVAARYGWSPRPFLNLRTASGLPVSPFRTDDLPIGK